MATTETITGNSPDLEADVKAVYEAFAAGRPVDPEVAQRVRERVARLTEETRRTHGLIDDETFQKLLNDDDEEA